MALDTSGHPTHQPAAKEAAIQAAETVADRAADQVANEISDEKGAETATTAVSPAIGGPSNTLDNFVGPHDFKEKDFRERVSLTEYAKLGAILGTLPPIVVADVARRSLRKIGNPRSFSIREAAFDSAATHIASRCNWPQLRRLCPVRPLRVELKLAHFQNLHNYNHYFGGDSYSARWLVEKPNRQPEDPVLLYMHGGSYALKIQRPQLSYLVKLHKELLPLDVSILLLDYTIAPHARFPTQLDEGMACYNELRKSCNNVIFYGDSAGGHLALTMLMSGARCENLVLVSPSVDMTSGHRDDNIMREVFVDDSTHRYDDPLISPLFADPQLWPKLLPSNTTIVWGGAEPCKQQMIEFAKIANIEAKFEEPGGSHDCILRGNSNPGSRFILDYMRRTLLPESVIESSPFSSKSSSRTPSIVDPRRSRSMNDVSQPDESGKVRRRSSILSLWRNSKI